MHPRIILFGFILLLVASVPFSSFALELKTAAQESAPKYYKSDTGQMSGICVDIIHAIERVDPDITLTGYQEFIPFRRLQYLLEQGQLDMFLGMKQTKERKKKFKFLDTPLYSLNYVVAVRKSDEVKIKTFDDIRSLQENRKILTVFGSAASTFLHRQGGLEVDDSARSPTTLLKMLIHKRGRFAFYHDLGLENILEREGLWHKIKIIPISFSTYSHYAAFSQNVPDETVDKVRAALKKLKASGELTEIQKNYNIYKVD